MSNTKMVEELVMTRINGNQIKGNSNYERILKRVKKQDIIDLGLSFDIEGIELEKGTKLQLINKIAKEI